MNKIKLSTPLKLNKDSVSKLQESQMASVKGGKVAGAFGSSGPACTCSNGVTCKPNTLEEL
ncbi:rSAM-modified peptide [Elizabethkingia anophelis]|uniref:class I lanthipeptide n=1 Tax=Elizabethkingia anophelis TaxID=1117645 RepID=UPI0021A6BA0F|nr:rSAM-modified peptide [Elizabethkingia anophelis]MCT4301428.1 rSAM-modified peptide [Elizabethkingia anophelis]